MQSLKGIFVSYDTWYPAFHFTLWRTFSGNILWVISNYFVASKYVQSYKDQFFWRAAALSPAPGVILSNHRIRSDNDYPILGISKLGSSMSSCPKKLSQKGKESILPNWPNSYLYFADKIKSTIGGVNLFCKYSIQISDNSQFQIDCCFVHS